MKIVLVGFMGTGKTTVGMMLADRLQLQYIDTDEVIAARENMEISEIFSEFGEKFFRESEEEVLREILTQEDEFVLSTGGGIVISPANREIIKKNSLPFLLKASPEEIYNRTSIDNTRPLLKVKNTRDAIEELLETRKNYYDQFSMQIETDGKEPEVIVEEIIEYIKQVEVNGGGKDVQN